jgi:hypothetical protein
MLAPPGSAGFSTSWDVSQLWPKISVKGTACAGLTAAPPKNTNAKAANVPRAEVIFPAALPRSDICM